MTFGTWCDCHELDVIARLTVLAVVLQRRRIVLEREADRARAYEAVLASKDGGR